MTWQSPNASDGREMTICTSWSIKLAGPQSLCFNHQPLNLSRSDNDIYGHLNNTVYGSLSVRFQ